MVVLVIIQFAISRHIVFQLTLEFQHLFRICFINNFPIYCKVQDFLEYIVSPRTLHRKDSAQSVISRTSRMSSTSVLMVRYIYLDRGQDSFRVIIFNITGSERDRDFSTSLSFSGSLMISRVIPIISLSLKALSTSSSSTFWLKCVKIFIISFVSQSNDFN